MHAVLRNVLLFGLLALTLSCSKSMTYDTSMNSIGERYTKLVLAYGVHEPEYVDAYYGPEEWRTSANEAQSSLAKIKAEILSLAADLSSISVDANDEATVRRKKYLGVQIAAFEGRLRMRDGQTYTFDEESKLLYDAVAPHNSDEYFQGVIDRLDDLLPGEGSLRERFAAFNDQFIIPPDKVDEVFQAAIGEARRRTKQYFDLPENEHFTVEYVTDKPWGGYNWYQGDMHSIIQVNMDLPSRIGRAVGLAAHEGYPGHHVLNLMIENELVNKRGWMEYSVFPLHSPLAIIAEGSGNYGVQMAFPGEEQLVFERDVLFPIAGLDPALARTYFDVRKVMLGLGYASNEAARAYLDGNKTKEEVIAWMVKYGMATEDRASKSISFYETYRSYVISYNLGQDIVKNWIESNGGTADHPEKRWELFGQLISAPRSASELQID